MPTDEERFGEAADAVKLGCLIKSLSDTLSDHTADRLVGLSLALAVTLAEAVKRNQEQGKGEQTMEGALKTVKHYLTSFSEKTYREGSPWPEEGVRTEVSYEVDKDRLN